MQYSSLPLIRQALSLRVTNRKSQSTVQAVRIKQRIAVATSPHEITAIELSLSNIIDGKVLPYLLKKIRKHHRMLQNVMLMTQILFRLNEPHPKKKRNLLETWSLSKSRHWLPRLYGLKKDWK